MNSKRFSRILSKIKKLSLYPFFRIIVFALSIKLLSLLFTKEVKKNLIIMGSYGGEGFLDNTKYLFRYLSKNSDYTLIWITKNKKTMKDMKEKGYNVIYQFSLRAISYLKKANYIFLTHGVVDILPIEFSPKTTVIATWHGVQNKKNKISGVFAPQFPMWTKYLHLNINHVDVFDYFITPSGTKKDLELISRNFSLKKSQILTTGYPRNDILFLDNNEKIEFLKKKYKIPSNIKKVFLYAPTFRDECLVAQLPLDDNLLKKLNKLLEKNQFFLLNKAHMYERKVNFEHLTHIDSVSKDADIQELLLISDALITDYSSVYCDYLLLDRPILFFTYDLDEFLSEGRGFYYDFEEIVPGPLIYDGKDLINAINNIEKIDREYKPKRIETRKIYQKYIDGNSSERILEFIKKLDKQKFKKTN